MTIKKRYAIVVNGKIIERYRYKSLAKTFAKITRLQGQKTARMKTLKSTRRKSKRRRR